MKWFIAVLLAALPGVAQQQSAFAAKHFPGGVPPTVSSLGKLVHVLDGADLHVWSASTRSWHTQTVGAGASIFATNDLLLARSSGSWFAFGSSRGRFEPLSVSAAAQLVNPSSQVNDSALLVRDGLLLHAFSGFTGRWTSRSIHSGAVMAVSRHVALLSDGSLLSGYDSFTGQWTDAQADGPLVTWSGDGVCGFAATANTAYGFSALRRAWSSAPCQGSASLVRNDDWSMMHDGAFALAYSGITNSFASAMTGALVGAAGDDLLGLLHAQGLMWAYSAVTGSFSAVACGSTATLRTSAAAALLEDGTQVAAYSAPLGTWSQCMVAAASGSLAGSVAAVVDAQGGQPCLYSAMTGTWHLSPGDAGAGLPLLSTVGALLTQPAGAYAFSARTGAFVPLVGTGLSFVGNQNSAPLLAWDATGVHLFDARADRWVSATRSGSGPLQPQVWRTCGFVQDGVDVLGFSAQTGKIERQAWMEATTSFRANSDSVTLVGTANVLAFSAVPEALPLAQFPEFRRVVAIGAPFLLHLSLPQGSVALLGIGSRSASPSTLPGLGELFLDPNGLATLLMLPEPDADRAVFSAPLPSDPALRGQSVWFQALVAPANAQPYLTDAGVAWIG